MIYRSAFGSLVRIPRLSTHSRSFHPLSMSLVQVHILKSQCGLLTIAHIVRWCQTMTLGLGVHGLSHISFVGRFLGFGTGFTKCNRHHRLIISVKYGEGAWNGDIPLAWLLEEALKVRSVLSTGIGNGSTPVLSAEVVAGTVAVAAAERA